MRKMEFMKACINNQTSCAKRSINIFPVRCNVEKIFFTILFSLYLALSLISSLIVTRLFVARSIGLTAISLGLFALILLSTRIRRGHAKYYVFVGLLVTSLLISSFIVGRTGRSVYLPTFFIISNFGIALILIRGYVYSWGGYIVFYGLAVYFLMLMLAGVDLTLTMGSTNIISIAILIACISLYIILSRENKKIDLKPALFTLAISIWGLGRSGIISSFVLLLGLIYAKIRANRKYFYVMIIFLIIFLLSAYWFFDYLYKFVMDCSFLRKAIDFNVQRYTRNASDPRFNYWTYYFNNLNLSRLIFGVNAAEVPWPDGEINEYNFHNSFIHLHLQTGLMGLVTMVLILFALFKYYRTHKLFFFLLLSFVLRSTTDLFIFFSRFDFILFFFIFYFLKSPSPSGVSFSKPSIGSHLDIGRVVDYQQMKNDVH